MSGPTKIKGVVSYDDDDYDVKWKLETYLM